MHASHPSVHPVEVPPTVVHHPPRVRMKDYQGMPGTFGSLVLRFGQFCFAVAAFAVMVSINDFSTVTAFWSYGAATRPRAEGQKGLNPNPNQIQFFDFIRSYLVAATVLQCLWSLALGVIDGYALLVKRSLRNSLVVSLFVVGDAVTATLTFAAACASAGITVLIGNDLRECDHNHCAKYETATAMAFLSWFMVSPSFLLNFWLLATR